MSLFRRVSDGSKLQFHFLEVSDAEFRDISALVTLNGGKVGPSFELPVRFVQRDMYRDGMYPSFRLYDIEFIRMCVRKGKLVKLQPFRLGPKKLADHCIANSFLYGHCPYEKMVSASKIRRKPMISDSSSGSDNDSDVEMNSNGIDKSSVSPEHPSPKNARLSVDESQSVVTNAHVRRTLVDTSKFQPSRTLVSTSKNNPRDSPSNTVDATIAEMRKTTNEDRDERTIEPSRENKSSENVSPNRVIGSQISEYDTGMEQIDIKEESPLTMDWEGVPQSSSSTKTAETPLTRPSYASPVDRPSPNVTPSLPDLSSTTSSPSPRTIVQDCSSRSNDSTTVAKAPKKLPRLIVKSRIRLTPDALKKLRRQSTKISTNEAIVKISHPINRENSVTDNPRDDVTRVSSVVTDNVVSSFSPMTIDSTTLVDSTAYREKYVKSSEEGKPDSSIDEFSTDSENKDDGKKYSPDFVPRIRVKSDLWERSKFDNLKIGVKRESRFSLTNDEGSLNDDISGRIINDEHEDSTVGKIINVKNEDSNVVKIINPTIEETNDGENLWTSSDEKIIFHRDNEQKNIIEIKGRGNVDANYEIDKETKTCDKSGESDNEKDETKFFDDEKFVRWKMPNQKYRRKYWKRWRARLADDRSDDIPLKHTKFTRLEQEQMIDYLLTFDDILGVYPKGLKIWSMMMQDGILQSRTAQSLQNNFVKKILPNIEEFFAKMTEKHQEQFLTLRKSREKCKK